MAPVPQRADAARPCFREWEVSIVQENHSDGILPESKCIEEVYSGKAETRGITGGQMLSAPSSIGPVAPSGKHQC